MKRRKSELQKLADKMSNRAAARCGEPKVNPCWKEAYDTAAEAERQFKNSLKRKVRRKTRGLSTKAKHGTGAKISAYKCDKCGKFHWGHNIKGNKHGTKIKS